MGAPTDSLRTYETRVRRVENLEEDFRRYQEERQALVDTAKQIQALGEHVGQVRLARQGKRNAVAALRRGNPSRHRNEPSEQKVRMRLGGGRTGTIALRATALSSSERVQAIHCEVRFGQRIAVCLVQMGRARVHFLRLIAGTTGAAPGELMLGARINVGYFSQTPDAPRFYAGRSWRFARTWASNAARACPRYGATRLDQRWDVRFENLSGGQQARLQILLLELRGSTLLALDEPTDNLDVASAEALEHALASTRVR